jgi:hypothetical protein
MEIMVMAQMTEITIKTYLADFYFHSFLNFLFFIFYLGVFFLFRNFIYYIYNIYIMTEPTGSTDYRFGTTDEKQHKTSTSRPTYVGSNDDSSKGGASSNEIQINSQTWQNKSQTR